MAALIGALRVTLGADTSQFSAGMTKAQRQAATSSSAITKSLGTVKAGLAGFASALTIGLLANVIKSSLDYAGSLGEIAQQLGVTTRDLQNFRAAAGQSGISTEEMDKGLLKLRVSLGQVAAGAKAPTKALEAIGITARDLSGLDTGQAFRKIADGLQKVTSSSQRAAVEVALFGRTGAKLDTLLAGGSASINELARANEELGGVLSDEQIQNADATADKLGKLQLVLKTQIAGVVADNADAILYLANSFVTLVGSIGSAWRAYSNFVNNIDASVAARANDLIGRKDAAARARGQAYQSGVNPTIAGSSVTVRLGPAKPFKSITPAGADIGKFLAGGGGAGKKGPKDNSARDAERARLDALQDAYSFDQDMRRADMDVLRAKESLATDYTERSALSIQMLDLERAGYAAELANEVATGKRTQAQAGQLQAQYDITDGLNRQKVLQDEEIERQQIYNSLEETDFNLRREMLEQQAGLAETASERRAVELQILDLALQEARQRQARLEKEGTWAEVEEGRRNLAGMEERQAGAKEGVMRGTRGPLEEYMKSLPDSAAKMNEALEGVAAGGLQSIQDGILGVITGAKSMGDAFKDIANQIIADLIRIMIQKAIVGALDKALGGLGRRGRSPAPAGSVQGYNGVGGDLFEIPGLARGGSFTIMGNSGTDRNVMSLNGLPIARVSKGERVNVSNDNANASGGGGGRIQITPSPYFNVVVEGLASNVAAPMVSQGVMVAAGAGQQSMMRRARRSIP